MSVTFLNELIKLRKTDLMRLIKFRCGFRTMHAKRIFRMRKYEMAKLLLRLSAGSTIQRALQARARARLVNDSDPFTMDEWRDVSESTIDLKLGNGKYARYTANNLFKYLHGNATLLEPICRTAISAADIGRLERLVLQDGGEEGQAALRQFGWLHPLLDPEHLRLKQEQLQSHCGIHDYFTDELSSACTAIESSLQQTQGGRIANDTLVSRFYHLEMLLQNNEALNMSLSAFHDSYHSFCCWSSREGSEFLQAKLKELRYAKNMQLFDLLRYAVSYPILAARIGLPKYLLAFDDELIVSF